jgi:hypothetical protein
MLPSTCPVIKILLHGPAIQHHLEIKNTGLSCSKDWKRYPVLHSNTTGLPLTVLNQGNCMMIMGFTDRMKASHVNTED